MQNICKHVFTYIYTSIFIVLYRSYASPYICMYIRFCAVCCRFHLEILNTIKYRHKFAFTTNVLAAMLAGGGIAVVVALLVMIAVVVSYSIDTPTFECISYTLFHAWYITIALINRQVHKHLLFYILNIIRGKDMHWSYMYVNICMYMFRMVCN